MGNGNFRGNQRDIIIVVIGQTGCGKSNFINKLRGTMDEQRSAGGLRADTQDVTPYCINKDGSRFVLVDTPGFDDASRPDSDVLWTIYEWLKQRCPSVKPAGIIYLHRITDNRPSDSFHKNLQTFSRFCGSVPLPRTCLVTTLWDKVKDQERATRRETELEQGFWSQLKREGVVTKRFYNTQDSAWDIVQDIIPLHQDGGVDQQINEDETDDNASCLSAFCPVKRGQS